MPTTTLVDTTFSASLLGARTDNTGTAVTDTSAEEMRMLMSIVNPGWLTPTASFQVTAQSTPNMTVKVGSGTAKTDFYVVSGSVAGQGNYVIRLDAVTPSVTISAADVSQTRTDEVYLVVQDNFYDVSSRVLPRLGYRKGDLGGANPGPDASWTASALLARVTVAPAVTSITNTAISNQRVASTLLSPLLNTSAFILNTLMTTKGDILAATEASTPARLGVGANNTIMVADSAQTPGMKWGAIPVSFDSQLVLVIESTTSTSFTGLVSPGPTATVTVGAAGMAIVSIGCGITVDTTAGATEGVASVNVTGANTIAPSDVNAVRLFRNAASAGQSGLGASRVYVLTGLTAGSTSFSMQYRSANGSSGGTLQFFNRQISVVAF